MLDSLTQDIRYAIRQMARRPGFTVVVVLTLALGIGANTAIFSLLNTLLFRPLPFENGERLVRMRDAMSRPGREPWLYNSSPRSYYVMKEWDGVFDGVTAQRHMIFNITGSGDPARITGIGVSEDWLSTLGVEPLLGRGFAPEEERAGRDSRVALIGYGLWQRRFGGDSNVIGNTLTLNGQVHTIIGVMPALFNYPYGAEIWVAETFDRNSGRFGPNVVARLKPGMALEAAQTELDALSERIRVEYPDTHASITMTAVPIRDDIVRNHPRIGVILLGAVGFLLLIACANVANLLLARGASRRTEFAIRVALGAGRFRQVRQLVTENIILALLGMAVGLLLTLIITDALAVLSVAPTYSLGDFFNDIRIDGRVLGFGLAVALATTLVFGLFPAIKAANPDLQGVLKEAGRSSRSPGQRLMKMLVVSEVAVALVLLAGAGLMIQNFNALQHVDPGYEPENRLSVELALPAYKYPGATERLRFVERVIERTEALPGVLSAGVSTHLPLSPGSTTSSYSVEGGPASEPGSMLLANIRVVSADYLPTMGIPLLRGRQFRDEEVRENRDVVIVSQPMARRYWPDTDPIGRRIKFGGLDAETPWYTIVGVVGDVEELYEVEETVYIPQAAALPAQLRLVVRTATDPGGFSDILRSTIWEVDADQPVEQLIALDQLVSDSLSQERLGTTLMQTFAAFALLLAALGLYGVTAYSVSQRTHEIGIRKALGCQPRGIFKLILKQATILALLGVAIGTPMALALTRTMSNVLSGANANAPVRFRMMTEVSSLPTTAYIAIMALLLTVALFASYVPARRANKVDPTDALRAE
jgi:putative ABC transport system permease protein